MIDPSHGGYDKGADFGGNLVEKDITLKLARELRKELEERGIASRMLRDSDVDVPLERRAEITNEQRAGIYVALHAGRPGRGVRVYTPLLVNPEQPAGRFLPWESRLLMTTVVLVAIDLAGLAVLLAVHLGALLRGEFATVRSTVVADFVVNLGFIVFEVRGLASGELSALDALSDAVLLVLGSLANFALGIGVLHRRVVLVLVDLLGHLILLLSQGLLVGIGKLAVVEFAHVALFLVDGGFFLLEVGGFAGSELSALDALSDAVLLVFFAFLDRLSRNGRVLGHNRQRENCKRCTQKRNLEGALHGVLSVDHESSEPQLHCGHDG